MINQSSLTYTRLFCEENIWKLIAFLNDAGQSATHYIPIDVLFLINPQRSVAIYQQKAVTEGQLMIWDYHVILSARHESGTSQQPIVIFDFDSRLPFPTPITDYFNATFANWHVLPDTLRPQIRSIPANEYLQGFDSDRSHMKGLIKDSEYPEYPEIHASTDARLSLTDLYSTEALIQYPLQSPGEYLKLHNTG